jgi:hypothetical protein
LLSFIEKKIQIILSNNKQEKDINNLIDFLNTHAHYFKLRIATTNGEEIFKVVQNRETKQYEQSKSLYNLSGQDFFKELSQVKFDEFYFSSMEANIINGVPENPIRPAIRVSKRIKYQNNREALLVLNIDGSEIFQLFVGQTFDPTFATEKFLVDHKGFTVSSYPLLNEEEYTKKKVDISEKTFKVLVRKQFSKEASPERMMFLILLDFRSPRVLGPGISSRPSLKALSKKRSITNLSQEFSGKLRSISSLFSGFGEMIKNVIKNKWFKFFLKKEVNLFRMFPTSLKLR